MPFSFRPRRYARRRTYSKKRTYTGGRKKRNSRFKAGWKRKMSGGSPFPLTKFCTLKYAWNSSLGDEFTTTGYAAGINNNARRTFRLNSLYDPDQETGGLQPRYFDNLCGADVGVAPYAQFRVHAAKIKVTFNNGNSAGNSNGFVALRIRDSAIIEAGTSASPADWGELPFTSWIDIGSSGGISQRRSFRKFVKIGKFYGIKDISGDETLTGSYAGNPTKQLYADIAYHTPFPVADYALNTVVEIKYYCEFFNRNYPLNS